VSVRDELEPVAGDVIDARRKATRPTKWGRTFGALLAFLAVWQILSPDSPGTTICAWAVLGASVLWFVPCPRYLRFLATVAGLALCVVVVLLE
jgi:hypothetical protein